MSEGDRVDSQNGDFSVESVDGLLSDDMILRQAKIARFQTKNWIARALVISLIASFPVTGLLCAVCPQHAEIFNSLFERWLTVTGPLAGAAIGVDIMSRDEA